MMIFMSKEFDEWMKRMDKSIEEDRRVMSKLKRGSRKWKMAMYGTTDPKTIAQQERLGKDIKVDLANATDRFLKKTTTSNMKEMKAIQDHPLVEESRLVREERKGMRGGSGGAYLKNPLKKRLLSLWQRKKLE